MANAAIAAMIEAIFSNEDMASSGSYQPAAMGADPIPIRIAFRMTDEDISVNEQTVKSDNTAMFVPVSDLATIDREATIILDGRTYEIDSYLTRDASYTVWQINVREI